MAIILALIGLILFDLIICIHEWGHFFSAKTFGIKVNEFALGMGPRILKLKKGETIFSLRLFPIGGFCEMEGEDEESDNPGSFEKKAVWKRIIVIVMGAVMNLILGFLMTVLIMAQSPKFPSTTIANFAPDAVSSSAGLQAGDEILKLDGAPIFTYKDLAFSVAVDRTGIFDVEVRRAGNIIEVKDVSFKVTCDEQGNKTTNIDFRVRPIEKTFGSLMKQSFLDTVSTVRMVWTGLFGIITGKTDFNSVTGPIGIASVIGEATTEGLKTSVADAIWNIVTIMAMITINLGVVNLLPLPALDGGRLVFLLFELITRKKINPKYEGWIHAFGLFLFIALMLVIAYKDILRLFRI